MLMPDYDGGSIVNLMSSVASSFGVRTKYPELKLLPAKTLREYDNVVLFVMDGLGYESLKGYKDLLMHENLKGKMTSVFPPTTAACLTTFATGLPPQQTAITSWFMNLKELGMVTKILPFSPRLGKDDLSNEGIDPGHLIGSDPLAKDIHKKGHQIYSFIPRALTRGAYAKTMHKYSIMSGYRSYSGLGKRLKKVLKSGRKKKFIYCYSPLFDSACHLYGTKSREAKQIAMQFDVFLENLGKRITNTNTALIVTADHGLIDSPSQKRFNLNSHKEFYDCLSLPMCGEPRAAFLYVRPSKEKKMKEYFNKKFSKHFVLMRSEDAFKKGLFGKFKAHSRLSERIGDYIMFAKDNSMVKDFLINDEIKYHVANHGGLSKEELYVPLIFKEL